MTSSVATPRQALGLLPLAEFAVTLMGFAVAMGFGRVFGDDSYRQPLLISVLVAHALAVIARRLGVSLSISALMSAAGLLVTQSLLHYGASTRYGLPTSSTREQITTDLTDAWTLFGNISAPVDPVPGFLLAASVGLWLVMFLADWAAFRMQSGFEAVLPPTVIFIFVSLFAADQQRLLATALFAATVLLFIVAHRSAALEQSNASWLGGTSRRGTQSMLAAGGAIAAISLLFGLLAGPQFPGADDEPIIDLEKVGDGPGTRVALNPLVGIQAQLLDLPNTVAFTVKADEPTYWKLTSLPSFDGKQFTANESFAEVDGPLESVAPKESTYDLSQEFTIDGLAGEWLPAAHEPRSVESLSEDFKINWNADISSLIIRDRSTTVTPGMTYQVTSGITTPDLAAIQAATIPEDIDEVFLELPGDFSETARQIARQVTATATTPYEQALMLQQYFINNFDYDIDVARGHSIERIDDFLAAQVGYCEQFSTAYATMARSLGLPTRVSIGFTEGEYSADEGLYRVRGAQAHAWPEVFFEDIGWLRFEPTPGRGAPGDQVYTGQSAEPAPAPEVTPPTSTTAAPRPERPVTSDPGAAPVTQPPADVAAGGSDSGSGWQIPVRVVLALFAVLAALGLVGGSILALKSRQRTKALSVHPDENRRRIAEVWLSTEDKLTMAGIPPRLAETPTEFASRAGGQHRALRDDLVALAGLVTAARYRQSAPSDEDVQAAREFGARTGQYLDERFSWIDRSKFALDPRPLFPEKSSVATR